HILHISTPKTWRGGEQQLAYLLQELPQYGVKNMVLTHQNSVLTHYCKKNQITHNALAASFPVKLLNPFLLKKLCKKNHIDLIHVHDAHAHTLAIYAATIAGNKAPIVVSRRVDFPIKDHWLSRYKYNHPLIKKILCVSNEIKRITIPGIKEPDKLEVVYSGVDTNHFADQTKGQILRSTFQIGEEYWLIGNTSVIAEHKDYFTFVDVAGEVIRQGIKAKFIIIGSGPKEEAVKSYIKSKGLENEVLFTGFRDDAKHLLLELDILLMTSKTEGLGTSILDAMAAHIPVIATQAGGIPEMIHHEATGLLAPVGASQTLAECIKRLIADRDLSQHLVRNGHQLLLRKFSKEQMAKATYDQYQSVLHKPAS
ncbi:MAG: hypothetical protein BRD49_00095, partial [Bacteroidetes bacterium SW_10_40_5]